MAQPGGQVSIWMSVTLGLWSTLRTREKDSEREWSTVSQLCRNYRQPTASNDKTACR